MPEETNDGYSCRLHKIYTATLLCYWNIPGNIVLFKTIPRVYIAKGSVVEGGVDIHITMAIVPSSYLQDGMTAIGRSYGPAGIQPTLSAIRRSCLFGQ